MREIDRFGENLVRLVDTKEDKTIYYAGLLGTLDADGNEVVDVPGRSNFSYVRLNGSFNEVIEAFNTTVQTTYGLKVRIAKKADEFFYEVLSVDTQQYPNYGGGGTNAFLPKHAFTHSFGSGDGVGLDPVFIYKRQLLQPLGVQPISTGTAMYAKVNPDFYTWNNEIKYFSGDNTVDFSPAKPTGSSSVWITVYIDGNTNLLGYVTGTYFTTSFFTPSTVPYIPEVSASVGIALAGILLASGTATVNWDNTFDLRNFLNPGGIVTSAAITGVAQGAILYGGLSGTVTQLPNYFSFDGTRMYLGATGVAFSTSATYISTKTGSSSGFLAMSHGGIPFYGGRGLQGSPDNPSVPTGSQTIFSLEASGYEGGYTGRQAHIRAIVGVNNEWSSGNRETYWDVAVTASGSSSIGSVFRFRGDRVESLVTLFTETLLIGQTGTTITASPTQSTPIAYVLPDAQGAVDTYLKNDGSGNLSWGTVTGSGGGGAFTGTHNDLTGLQGGSAGEYYHLSSGTFYNLVSGGLGGSGTVGRIAQWVGITTLGDSLLEKTSLGLLTLDTPDNADHLYSLVDDGDALVFTEGAEESVHISQVGRATPGGWAVDITPYHLFPDSTYYALGDYDVIIGGQNNRTDNLSNHNSIIGGLTNAIYNSVLSFDGYNGIFASKNSTIVDSTEITILGGHSNVANIATYGAIFGHNNRLESVTDGYIIGYNSLLDKNYSLLINLDGIQSGTTRQANTMAVMANGGLELEQNTPLHIYSSGSYGSFYMGAYNPTTISPTGTLQFTIVCHDPVGTVGNGGINLRGYGSGQNQMRLNFQRAAGTPNAPSGTSSGNRLGVINFIGYPQSGYFAQNSAQIAVDQQGLGVNATGIVPAYYRLAVANTTGVLSTIYTAYNDKFGMSKDNLLPNYRMEIMGGDNVAAETTYRTALRFSTGGFFITVAGDVNNVIGNSSWDSTSSLWKPYVTGVALIQFEAQDIRFYANALLNTTGTVTVSPSARLTPGGTISNTYFQLYTMTGSGTRRAELDFIVRDTSTNRTMFGIYAESTTNPTTNPNLYIYDYIANAQRMNVTPQGEFLVGQNITGQFPTTLTVAESTHATSRRASMRVGNRWYWLSDRSGNGVRDFGLYDSITPQYVMSFDVSTGTKISFTWSGYYNGGTTYLQQNLLTITSGTTNAIAVWSRVDTSALAITLGTAYGSYIGNPVKGTGSTITTNVGLAIENMTAGTNNYSIYSAGGTMYHAGNVILGTTTAPASGYILRAAGGLQPDADATYDLGSTALKWRNGIFSGSLNLNVTGTASAGEIHTSGKLVPDKSTNTAAGSLRFRTISLANNGSDQFLNVSGSGAGTLCFCFIMTDDGSVAIYRTTGGAGNTAEISDISATFSPSVGTPGMTNIYWSAGNSRYEIQNNRGSTKGYSIFYISYN